MDEWRTKMERMKKMGEYEAWKKALYGKEEQKRKEVGAK